MAKRDRLSGNEAVAIALRQINPDVFPAFPITPSTDAVPPRNIVRLHASSGTTGKATVIGYTRRDLDNWADLMARCLSMAGANASDFVHVAFGYGLFTGGLGAHYGAERLGATTIPVSGGATKRQVQLMRDFGATVLCCTPSYALFLYDAGLEAGDRKSVV